jgi:spherulation-specific family 4 protein
VNERPRSRRHGRAGLAALLAVSAVGIVIALAAWRGTSGDDGCRSALIPAYLSPDGIARIAERPVRDRIVVFNPDSGPGAVLRPAYRSAVAIEQRTGTRVLGYVHTGWGARDPAAVRADVWRYRSWYGVDGIFFDETAHDAAQLPYYAALARDARADGLGVVAFNPGTVPAREYVDLADIVVTFEGAASGYDAAMRSMPRWTRNVPRRKIAHLLYDATRAQALDAVTEGSAGYVYATSASLPDPWSTLPPYLDELEARLAGCT